MLMLICLTVLHLQSTAWSLQNHAYQAWSPNNKIQMMMQLNRQICSNTVDLFQRKLKPSIIWKIWLSHRPCLRMARLFAKARLRPSSISFELIETQYKIWILRMCSNTSRSTLTCSVHLKKKARRLQLVKMLISCPLALPWWSKVTMTLMLRSQPMAFSRIWPMLYPTAIYLFHTRWSPQKRTVKLWNRNRALERKSCRSSTEETMVASWLLWELYWVMVKLKWLN